MGTSKSKPTPKGGGWTGFKSKFTSSLNSSSPSKGSAGGLFNAYVGARGGTGKAFTQGISGSGISIGVSSGSNFGGFLSDVETVGLKEATDERGINLDQIESLAELSDELINHFCDAANDQDEINVRKAFHDLLDEVFKNQHDDIESIFASFSDPIKNEAYLKDFLANYVFETFKNDCDDLIEKNRSAGERWFVEIKATIFALIKDQSLEQKIESVDWKGKEGKQIIESILTKVSYIYGDE